MKRQDKVYHLILLILILGYYIVYLINKFESPLTWQSLSAAGVAVLSLLISLRRKLPSALMFFFSAFAMVFAVLYWPIKKGQALPAGHKLDLVDFVPSSYFFVFFLIFGYLYWFNRNRWE